jgi:hypothetical protein
MDATVVDAAPAGPRLALPGLAPTGGGTLSPWLRQPRPQQFQPDGPRHPVTYGWDPAVMLLFGSSAAPPSWAVTAIPVNILQAQSRHGTASDDPTRHVDRHRPRPLSRWVRPSAYSPWWR